MNTQNITPQNAESAESTDKAQQTGAHDHDHRGGPRGRGFGPGRGFGHGGPTIVIQNGAPQQFGPHRGFGGHHGFGPGAGFGPAAGAFAGPFARPFAGGKPPKKSEIRLFKRVRRIAVELGKYRGTATSEQRAQALAKLDETIVELKRILAS
jgi:hypothetical protein